MRSPNLGPVILNSLAYKTEPGSPIAKVYEPFFDGATTSLRVIGTRNIQKEMDEQAKYSDINYMLQQLKVGDMSVLSSRQPVYGDVSQLSNNPADVLNLVQGAEREFNKLPVADRVKYSNDWRVWFSTYMQDLAKPVASGSTSVSDDSSLKAGVSSES